MAQNRGVFKQKVDAPPQPIVEEIIVTETIDVAPLELEIEELWNKVNSGIKIQEIAGLTIRLDLIEERIRKVEQKLL